MHASKSGPRRTLEDLRLPWTSLHAWWMKAKPCATSSAIFKHDVQCNGLALLDLDPAQKVSKYYVSYGTRFFNVM